MPRRAASGSTRRRQRPGSSSFPGLAHRQEPIAVIDGVRYVNDSKATNADAAANALACYDDILWIAGGRAKEGGIAALAPFFPRIRRAFLIGEAAPAFAATLEGRVRLRARAARSKRRSRRRMTRRTGMRGATVLLSPACASFDQFADFEARGASLPPPGRGACRERAHELRPHRSERGGAMVVDGRPLDAGGDLRADRLRLAHGDGGEPGRRRPHRRRQPAFREALFRGAAAGARDDVRGVAAEPARHPPHRAGRLRRLARAAGRYTFIGGVEIKGARRWIELPGLSLQPSEFIKPTFAVVAAWLFAQYRLNPGFPGHWIAMALYVLVVGLLIQQPDLGMAAVVSAVWFAQFFLAGLRLYWVAAGLFAGAGGLVGAYLTLPHVASRIDRFLDPASGDSYQVDRSMEAFSNGGVWGRGPGEGTVKEYLPDAHADFVFAVAGEELGLVVCLVIVAVFAFIVLRGFSRLMQEGNLFVVLAATGLLVAVRLQAIINMASALHLMPTKGMTLPFISYGGSSMLALGPRHGHGAGADAAALWRGRRMSARPIVLAAGGTGGHMFPAEALARRAAAPRLPRRARHRPARPGLRRPAAGRRAPSHPRRPRRRRPRRQGDGARRDGARHARGRRACCARSRRRRRSASAAIPRCRPCWRRRAADCRR